MSTITLYKDKIGSAGGLLGILSKNSDNLDTQLYTLKKTLQGASSSTCNLSDTISTVNTSAKSVSGKAEKIKKLNERLDDFILLAGNRDSSARDEINRSKDDFYSRYSWLKPDCEKSTLEKIEDKIESVCDWCCEHWQIVVAVIAVIAIIALAFTVPGFAVALAEILKDALIGALKGALSGALWGGVINWLEGGSFLDGMINGALAGLALGALIGGFGSLGTVLGPFLHCTEAVVKGIRGFAGITGLLSNGMAAFDILAIADNVTGIFGGTVGSLNSQMHSNPFYNGIQIGVTVLAALCGGMGKNMTCFLTGTMVAALEGFIAIEQIKEGDSVLSAAPENKEQSYNRVIRTIRHSTSELLRLLIDDEVIITTPNHLFYEAEKGFILAGSLVIGAHLLTASGSIATIEQIYRENCPQPQIVYNLEVENDHTYFVGDISVLVHNNGCKQNGATKSDSTKIVVTKETNISSDMQEKILEGKRAKECSQRIIGGHSSIINNDNSKYAVEVIKENGDGTTVVKYVKELEDGTISNIKTSTLFPDNWSDNKIIESIKKVGSAEPIGIRSSDGTALYRDIIEGVQMDVIKIGDKVTSAYPTGGNVIKLVSGFVEYVP